MIKCHKIIGLTAYIIVWACLFAFLLLGTGAVYIALFEPAKVLQAGEQPVYILLCGLVNLAFFAVFSVLFWAQFRGLSLQSLAWSPLRIFTSVKHFLCHKHLDGDE